MLKFKGLYILLVSGVQGVEGARSSEVTGGVALNQRTQMPSLLAAGIPLWLQMPRMCGTNPQDLVRFPPHLLPALTPPPSRIVFLLPRVCCSCLLSLICPVAPALRPVHVCLSVITSPSLLCLPPHCLPTDYPPRPTALTASSAALLGFLFLFILLSIALCPVVLQTPVTQVLKFICISVADPAGSASKVTTLEEQRCKVKACCLTERAGARFLQDVV